MVSQSVNEPTGVINQNQINDVLLKAEALLQVALNSNFYSEPAYIMHDYLWVLSDLVSHARKLM
jgi:hypothetical protein